MKVDASNVGAVARDGFQENLLLARYLREQNDLSAGEVDEMVARIARQVWASLDCTTCGKCCRDLQPGVTDADVADLCRRLGMSESEFHARYLVDSTEVDYTPYQFRRMPCVFLVNGRCSVYEDRPDICRRYPYLDEGGFSHKVVDMIDRAETCPIVCMVLEELKAALTTVFSQAARVESR